jgi:hypothetical protein
MAVAYGSGAVADRGRFVIYHSQITPNKSQKLPQIHQFHTKSPPNHHQITIKTLLNNSKSISKSLIKNPGTHLNVCAVLSQLGRHTVAIEHARAALVILQAELFGEDGCVWQWQWLGGS